MELGDGTTGLPGQSGPLPRGTILAIRRGRSGPLVPRQRLQTIADFWLIVLGSRWLGAYREKGINATLWA